MNSNLKIMNSGNFFARLDRGARLAGGIFFLSLAIYLYLAVKLIHGFDFNDETEKMIAAKLIVQGHRVYKDIFLQHGPLVYMISHLAYIWFGADNLVKARAIPIILSLMSIAAVVYSPVFQHWRSRFYAGVLMVAGLCAVQTIYALVMTMYQVYAGYIIVIFLAVFLLPLCLGRAVDKWQALIGGVCLSALFFLAFSFSIDIAIAILIYGFLAYGNPNTALPRAEIFIYALAGGLGVALAVFAWLSIYGDIYGYFLDHFYFNLKFYHHYLAGISIFNPLHFLVPGWTWWLFPIKHLWYTQLLFLVPNICCVFLCYYAYRNQVLGRTWPKYVILYLLLLALTSYTSPRYEVQLFSASTQIITIMGLFALTLPLSFQEFKITSPRFAAARTAILILFILAGIAAQFLGIATLIYSVSPRAYYKYKGALTRQKSPEMDFIRRLVPENEGVQQFPFNLMFYTETDRLPAFPTFYWMPWQNDYLKTPVAGYEYDVCAFMAKTPPKVVFMNEEPLWGNPISTFLGCVTKVLDAKYLRSTKLHGLWVRADVVADHPEALAAAIVPKNYNADWLPAPARARIDAVKINFDLITTADHVCLIEPAPSDIHDPVKTGACDDPRAMHMAWRRVGEGAWGQLIAQDNSQCLEVTDASAAPGAPLRLWPCGDGRNQLFTFLPAKNGGRLQAANSNLCLAASGGTAVQIDCAKAPGWQIEKQ